MIHTVRTFVVDRANVQRFVELSEQAIWPWLEGRDGRALGLWTVVMGGTEKIVLITRYDSLAHWQETRAWPENPQDTVRSPDLARLGREAIAERSAMTRETDLIALRPLSSRTPPEDTPDRSPGIYALRSFRVRPQDQAQFLAETEGAIWPWYEAQGARPLGCWRATVTEDPQIFMLTHYRDLLHWEATRSPGSEPSDPGQQRLWRAATQSPRSTLIQHSGVRILRPISARRP